MHECRWSRAMTAWLLSLIVGGMWLASPRSAHAQDAGPNIDFCNATCEVVMVVALIDTALVAGVLVTQIGYGLAGTRFPRDLAWFEIALAVPLLVLGAAMLPWSLGAVVPLAIGGELLTHGVVSLHNAPAASTHGPPQQRGSRDPYWHASVLPLPGAVMASLRVAL
jgi:hypothetical protein